MSRPCVFFDRDGIINHPPTLDRYVRNWEEFRLIPEFLDVLRLVLDRGYEAVVVTNQKGVATGRMSQEDVDGIHRNLRDLLEKRKLRLRDILVCTSGDENHTHRKPNPGMLLEAAEKYGLDLSASWMVGDNEKDVEAGRRAGCRTVLVGGSGATKADFRMPDLNALAAFFVENLPDRSAV